MTMSSKTCREFVGKRVVAFMLEVGADLGDITVKSDQELALMALVRVIGAHQSAGDGGRVLVDPSLVGVSPAREWSG